MTRAQQEATTKTTVQPSTLPAANGLPEALLQLTKNVLGENVTHTIEPLIKRVSADETPPQRRKQTRAELQQQLEVRTEALVGATTLAAPAANADQTQWSAQNMSGISVVPGNLCVVRS